MRLSPIQRLLPALSLALLASSAGAATYIVPADENLVSRADAIVRVTVQSSFSYFAPDGAIHTDSIVRVEESLKGRAAAGTMMAVTEAGGVVGDLAMFSSAAPSYRSGERAIAFLARNGSRWSTLDHQLGKFSLVTDAASRNIAVRGASDREIFGWDPYGRRHAEGIRDAVKFERFIEDVAAGRHGDRDYFLDESLGAVQARSHVPNGSVYLMEFSISGTKQGARWQQMGFEMGTHGTQTGISDLTASLATALSAWNDDPGSLIEIKITGPGSGTHGTNDKKNNIYFDQPNEGKLSGSTVGLANLWATSAEHQFNGHPYFTAVDCDILIERAMTRHTFEEVVAHELGHCLGFRHSNQGEPMSTIALMNSSVSGRGPVLGDWDREAAAHVYGIVVDCIDPLIRLHPHVRTVTAGQSASLTVDAEGEDLTFQWYRGGGSTTGAAIAGATGSTLNTGPLTADELFSVVVSNSCGAAESLVTKVTVLPACQLPVITVQPQSRRVGTGQTVTFSVTASGATSYQWYRGGSGNESSPIAGATGTSYTTPSLSRSEAVWVRVTNGCGSVGSAAAVASTQSRSRSAGRP
ncbi:MAG TPA: M57 family metalloprotease [Thermoanaerobaculia bacterium]|nr:M57 family metalloprotease [Thermoanaerobaculia bacterium]